MSDDPLLTTLLDLEQALGSPKTPIIVGGGYGLYLKQRHLQANPGIRTLIDLNRMPSARSTEDIDLMLRADVVTDSGSMEKIRTSLDDLGFTVVDSAKFMQFVRPMGVGQVKIDLLACPLGEFSDKVPKDSVRVRPRPSVNLHAHKTEEAVGVDKHPFLLPIRGKLSTGLQHSCDIAIPQAFSYLIMKIHAYSDRKLDTTRGLGQHHALDIYRIVGMVTKQEDSDISRLSAEFSEHPKVVSARQIAKSEFVDASGDGRLRIREHHLFNTSMDLNFFSQQLSELLRCD